jgi:hypothetical protein
MNRLIARLSVLAMLFGTSLAHGQNDMTTIETLKTGDETQRAEAVKALRQTRHSTIVALLQIMEGKTSSDVKCDVAKVLGEFRAVEAVDSLVRNLELDLRPRILKGLIKESDIHPISNALIEIGTPAIPALLAKIEETDNITLIERCVSICDRIEGREVAELILTRQIDKVSTLQSKQRLTQALTLIQKLK